MSNKALTDVTITDNEDYVLRISRLTIDKLGVKLYDKVSAVVAELVANSYDADTEKVTVSLPLATTLATKDSKGKIKEYGHIIEIVDDGHGMTPKEAREFYLQVGRDRRTHNEQGAKSRAKKRPVMGRKGIGKLAPFGICKRMEVMSAGGEKTSNGYLITHFFMDYDKILKDTDHPIVLEKGEYDNKYQEKSGTIIRLIDFLPKRVPDEETFLRQLATRFVFARSDFEIFVDDILKTGQDPILVKSVNVAIKEGTKIDLSLRPIKLEDGSELPVTGWLAMAKDPYKYEETAGVRIYARNKIVATTRDFEQPAGFTGEFTLRSYLVGEVFADWLDLDKGDDLIRSDRQGILWDSDYGRALREWGAKLIKEIGKKSVKPRRESTSAVFIEKSKIKKKAESKFGDYEIVDVALDLAKQIGGFAAEDDLQDQDYIDDLTEFILTVAPHKALIEAFQEFNKEIGGGEIKLTSLSDLFSKTRVAEMASYSQIASERVEAIDSLEKIINADKINEDEFQRLLVSAPWIIEPTWSVISKNQSLKTFKSLFESFYKKSTGEEVTLAIGYERKRPDFILVSVGHTLHIIEIKPKDHTLNDDDFERIMNYYDAFEDFFKSNAEINKEFPNGFKITVIADKKRLDKPTNKKSYESLIQEKTLEKNTWTNILVKAKNAHQKFLDIKDGIDEKRKKN